MRRIISTILILAFTAISVPIGTVPTGDCPYKLAPASRFKAVTSRRKPRIEYDIYRYREINGHDSGYNMLTSEDLDRFFKRCEESGVSAKLVKSIWEENNCELHTHAVAFMKLVESLGGIEGIKNKRIVEFGASRIPAIIEALHALGANATAVGGGIYGR